MEWLGRLLLLTVFCLALAEVGCDGVLGSGAVVDQCGICGGDGSTCRVISGIFTRTRLRQYGYHHVTTIPAGACNVNITELARSRNYLALLTASGENIMNGQQQLRPVGQYSGAGTTFDYRRRSGHWCPGACIFADGPLTMSVTVQLLYYDRNPGIMYHFTVPQHTAQAVMKAANNSHPHHNNHHPHHQNNRLHQNNHQNNHHDHQNNPNPAAEELEDGLSHRGIIRQRNRPRAFSGREKNEASHGKLASLQHVPTTIGASFDSSSSSTTTSSLRQTPSSPRDHPPSASRSGSRSRRPTSALERSGFRLVPASQSSSSSSSSSFAREELSSPGGSSSSGQRSGQSSSDSDSGGAESPLQRRPSILPNVASAPRYLAPEGEEGAPIEYRHYYHVNSDHYRQHAQRNPGFAALNSGSRWRDRDQLVGGGRSAGAEALSRPNLIPATHQARRRWRPAGGDVISNDVNAVGDVPLAVPASGYFVWTISGFSSCSRPCGGGTQQTTVVCMKSDTRVVVMAENCDVNARPTPTTMECNTQPCDPQWTEEDWSACSVSCGHGVETRRVECQQRISPTLRLSVSADRCPSPKPPVTQFCRQPPCFQWRASNWTECSTHCGLGERSRRAWCVSGEGQEVEASQCSPERRPRTRVLCDMGSCAKGWYYSKWSKQCSPECGAKTYRTRQVHCAAEDGASPLPGDRCPADRRPRTRKACGQPKPCGGKWFAGPWSQCNATCGEAWRSREVVCMKKHGRRLWGVVGKENCLRKERPLARDLCSDLPPCQPDWYMTHWSECSRPCGTGTKTREVKCLDSSLQPSLTCNAKRRPQERRPCNKHSCDNNDNDNNDNDDDNSTRSGHHHHHHHPNSYDQRPRKVASPQQRYQESTSPNTTFQRYRQRNRTRQPLALKASPPARVNNLQQDVRSALGDSSEDGSDHHHRHHKRRHHSHHHPSSSNTNTTPTTEASILPDDNSGLEAPTTPFIAEQQTTPPTAEAEDPQCTDKQHGRWCLFASQARLCGYSHYKRQCCQTCRKYNLHH